jgi:amidophosphoribosyltransferase
MPSPDELIAHGRSEDEVGKAIGADRLIYQELDDLIEAVRQDHPAVQTYDCSCFTGEYVTGDVTPEYLAVVAGVRADDVKSAAQERRSRDIVTVGLHNAE